MPQVRLERHEAENGYLPPVCMRCGAEATCQRRKDFKHTGSSGPAVNTWLIAPLCDAHRGHWLVRSLAVPLVLVGLGIAFCAGMISLAGTKPVDHSAAQMVFLAAGVGFIGWIVMACVLHYTSIRLRTFEFGQLELAGVAEEFVAALEQHRQSPNHETPLALQGADKSRRQVRLGRGHVDSLPAVCICCGDEATHWKVKTYQSKVTAEHTKSNIVGIVSLAVLGVGWISWNKLPDPWHVRLPFCPRHRRYFGWRYGLILGTPFLLIGVTWVVGYLIPNVSGWVCLGGFVGFLLWGGLAIYLYETMIQPVEVTDETLALKFVSDRFVEAIEQQRRTPGPQTFPGPT